MQHPANGPSAEWFLRAVFVLMALFSWAAVSPNYSIRWKGGNRAPLSMRSKVVSALAMTALCLASFRIYSPVFGGAFAVGICYLMLQSQRDRAAYDRDQGLAPVKPLSPTTQQRWLSLCAADGFFLLTSLFAVIRDSLKPPITEEQHIVHIMGLGYLGASALGAIILFIKRPKAKN
jgi:hypothetical protein